MIKVKSRGNETAEQMLRRFKKMCEKEGLTKDIKRIAYYEKPSEKRRRRQRKGPRIGGPSRSGGGGAAARDGNRARHAQDSGFKYHTRMIANDAAVQTDQLTKIYTDFWGRPKVK